MDGQADHYSRRWWFLLGAVFLTGVLLRFHTDVAQAELTPDEAFSWKVASAPTISDLVQMTGLDFHPPMYYLVLRAWMAFFGQSEMALKSLSGLCGLLTMAGVLWLVRLWVGNEGPQRYRPTALLAVLLVAVSPSLVAVSTSVRMYGLLALLALLGTCSLLEAFRSPNKWRWWLSWSAASTCMVYTHNYGLFFVASQATWLVLELLLDADRTHRRLVMRRGLMALGFIGLVYIPWVPWLAWQSGRVSQEYWILPMDWRSLGALGLQFFHQPMSWLNAFSIPESLFWAILTFLILWPWRRTENERHGLSLLGAHIVLITLATAMSGRAILVPRYLIHWMPLLAVPLAYWVVRIPDRPCRWAAAASVSVVLVASTVVHSPWLWRPGPEGLSDVAGYLVRHSETRDIVVATDLDIFLHLGYYLARDGAPRRLYARDDRLDYMEYQNVYRGCAARPEELFTGSAAQVNSARIIWVVSHEPAGLGEAGGRPILQKTYKGPAWEGKGLIYLTAGELDAPH